MSTGDEVEVDRRITVEDLGDTQRGDGRATGNGVPELFEGVRHAQRRLALGLRHGSDDASGTRRTGVCLSEGLDGLVCVETARVRNDPEVGTFERSVLASGRGSAISERRAVGRDPGDRHAVGPTLANARAESVGALAELVVGEVGRLRRGAFHDVGDRDPTLEQVASIVVAHPHPTVDLTVDDPGESQGGIEAIPRMGEVGLRRRGPQPGVDPDERQLRPIVDEFGDEIRHDRPLERQQLGPGETHEPSLTATDHTRVMDERRRTEIWPFFGLRVTTPTLTLRYPTEEDLFTLVGVAARGVHDPADMPFGVPWTRHDSPTLEREAMRFHWTCRAELRPESFRIPMVVVVDDEIVGATDLTATNFAVLRRFETGSWLGRDFQGRGLGTELRLATLTLGFDGLAAEMATTAAWDDNGPSLGVTRSLGYRAERVRTQVREGVAVRQLEFEMDRDEFAAVRRDDIALHGVEAVVDHLGL